MPITVTLNPEMEIEFDSLEILISDSNENVVFRKGLTKRSLGASFAWDLKSEQNAYVHSGCYTINLIASNSSEKIKCFSVRCRVADTRNLIALTRSLKHSHTTAENRALLSIYSRIIEDVESLILERLRNNEFEDPFFVAYVTASFIQQIVSDVESRTASRFFDRIAAFQSNHPFPEKDLKTGRLGLWGIFDFLVNYMADLEDKARANAMARCGKCSLTQNDKAQIVTSLVEGIYPHCKTVVFPKNVIGNAVEKVFETIVKFGIAYLSAKHVNKSISLSQDLPLGSPSIVIIH
jgi:hypothetical protein